MLNPLSSVRYRRRVLDTVNPLLSPSPSPSNGLEINKPPERGGGGVNKGFTVRNGMVRRESKTGTREMGQFASYRALDLLPPLFQVGCRLHASSLSFSSELVRGVLVHAHANSEAEKREELARAAVFRSSLPEGVREGEWKRIHCTSRSTATWFFA